MPNLLLAKMVRHNIPSKAMRLLLCVLGYFSLQQHVCALNFTVQSDLCRSQVLDVYKNSGSISDKRFCLNKTYIPGHAIGNFEKECLVEPENENLSYTDSAWAYYKCIVTKSLGSTPLTLTSYAEMMTGNLSAATKSAILLFLNENLNQGGSTATSLEEQHSNSMSSDITELRNLENYYNAYFDAEYHVCTNSSLNPCADELLEVKYIWNSTIECSERKYIPYIRLPNYNYLYNDYANCSSSMKKRHVSTNKTRDEIENATFMWCLSRGASLENQDENEIVDFVPLYNETMTQNFYSKNVKREAFNIFRKRFSNLYSKQNETIMESESVKDILSLAVKHLEVQLVEAGHTPENLNFLANAHISHILSGLKWHLQSEVSLREKDILHTPLLSKYYATLLECDLSVTWTVINSLN